MNSSGMKKPVLPHGWVVETSKTYPDRVYYFNVLTGATSWKCPQLLTGTASTEYVKPQKSTENKSTMQEADTSTSLEQSGVRQQTNADGSIVAHCKRKITFNESEKTVSSVSGGSKAIVLPKLKTVSPSVPTKSATKRKRKLKRRVLKDNNGSPVNSNKPERIILKAQRQLEHRKSDLHITKKVTVHVSSSSASKHSSTLPASSASRPSGSLPASSASRPSTLPASNDVKSSNTLPSFRGRCVNNVVNKNIINLKDSKSRFRQTLDQRPASLDDELLRVSSSGTSEYYDQDVEMPDLSELLTNEDLPEPMQVEEVPFNNGLYIVVDTNVFLRNLKYIESLMESSFEGWGYPNIRIPWAVIQELDTLKNNKNGKGGGSTVHKAAEAVRFVYRMLQCKHPRIRGQTAADASKSCGDLNAECNDDKILQYCIQLAESVGKKNVILLTEDKNLCNKAFINDIEVHIIKTLQKDLKICHHEKCDEKLEQEEAVPAKKTNSSVEQGIADDRKRRSQLEDLVDEAKVTTKDLLSFVVESEMKQAFDDIWEMIIFRKPPWTLLSVLECLVRHWMAVFGFLFQRDMKRASEELLSLLKNGLRDPEDEREVTKLFDLTSTICTCIYIKYGSESADRSLNQLEEIKKRWQIVYKSESELSTQDSESIVFSSFNYVWAVINHICGIIQDTLSYQCSITYEKPSVFPSREEIIQLLPKFHKKLERLYQEMNFIITSTAVDVNYKKAIFEFLTTFRSFTENLHIQLPSFPSLKQITPEMLEKYCTNAENKEKLTNGHYQLKHFLSVVERIAKEVFL